ncbi:MULTISPECIES: carbon-nitrogen family hydrolase [unclassified Paenibacillus]|uniref:carbon-nitrogen family hydrolase n=1 Tax=unclassified Paenibacillus TaxID=185978 RepID=UPI002F3EFD57
MSTAMRIALLQMDIKIGDVEANYEKVKSMIAEAAGQAVKPDVVIFPELWNTGFQLDQIKELADRNGERTRQLLSELSRAYKVNIIGGSIAELRGDEVYNTLIAFDRDGNEVADYSKIHLFRLMDEEKYLSAGEKTALFEVDGEKAGAFICYDTRFPELSRKLALNGAKIVFVPAQWPHPRLHHWKTLLMARAIENQMFVIACNRTGKSGDTHFFGHSMVIDPWGEVIAHAEEEETIIYADIDLALVDEVRARIPIFKDRRPEIYE